uniref:Uncharacterized protein n=1 Tax=Arundo donax TaxID=35708 RepID=A0A0A8Z5R5_ARUDO
MAASTGGSPPSTASSRRWPRSCSSTASYLAAERMTKA